MTTMTKKAQKEAERTEAIMELRKLLKPGATVHCILREVSRSGMSRRIDFYVQRKGQLLCITSRMSTALDKRRSDKGGLIVGGCGMDMGFAMVYALGRTLYPKGFKLAKNQYGRNGDKSGFDEDGGYALNHHWL